MDTQPTFPTGEFSTRLSGNLLRVVPVAKVELLECCRVSLNLPSVL